MFQDGDGLAVEMVSRVLVSEPISGRFTALAPLGSLVDQSSLRHGTFELFLDGLQLARFKVVLQSLHVLGHGGIHLAKVT